MQYSVEYGEKILIYIQQTMEPLTTQHILVILIGIGLCILFLKPVENFNNASRLPWGGWDQLVNPNPLDLPPNPPVTGGEPWQEPLLLAYGNSPTLNCGDRSRRNTC